LPGSRLDTCERVDNIQFKNLHSLQYGTAAASDKSDPYPAAPADLAVQHHRLTSGVDDIGRHTRNEAVTIPAVDSDNGETRECVTKEGY
jgi:hypothetical protein